MACIFTLERILSVIPKQLVCSIFFVSSSFGHFLVHRNSRSLVVKVVVVNLEMSSSETGGKLISSCC